MSVVQNTAYFIEAVAVALGIETRRISRLVIDADMMGGPVKVHVTVIPPEGAKEEIIQTVASADGILVTEAPKSIEERLLAQQMKLLDSLERVLHTNDSGRRPSGGF